MICRAIANTNQKPIGSYGLCPFSGPDKSSKLPKFPKADRAVIAVKPRHNVAEINNCQADLESLWPYPLLRIPIRSAPSTSIKIPDRPAATTATINGEGFFCHWPITPQPSRIMPVNSGRTIAATTMRSIRRAGSAVWDTAGTVC